MPAQYAAVTCRLDSVRVVLSNGQMEDPLENEEQLQEQMDSLPYMCRFQYDKSVELLTGRMDPIIAAYSKVSLCVQPPILLRWKGPCQDH